MEKNIFKIFKDKHTELLFIIIMAAGIFARVYMFGDIPCGINQDEAYAGYEAYSLLHYGKDSYGYHFPVYFISWGSGMNVLETYLMMPFIALFGLETWVIRLPQLIMSVITLIVSYLLMECLFDKRAGLITMFLVAIAPWHIMFSRWALESNLAPAFLMPGFYFFVRGMDRQVYYIVSAVMYGLSLYTYATIWVLVPFIILLEIIYAIYRKKININTYTVVSFTVLFVMALPLLLFLLVNKGYIDEIKTSFISIPRLFYMRSGEFSLQNIPGNFKNICGIMLKQTDGLATNVYGNYSIFYRITLVFFVLGMFFIILDTVKDIRKKIKEKNEEMPCMPQLMLLIQFTGSFLLTLLVETNVNRANSFIMSVLLIAAFGLYKIINHAGTKLAWAVVAIYLVLFANFTHAYFKSYNKGDGGYAFSKGFEKAFGVAMDKAPDGSIIYITPSVTQSRVMFYSKIPVDEYINTVVYNNYPGAFMGTDSFGRFCMDWDIYNSIDTERTYVLDEGTDTSWFEQAGFQIQKYGYYLVIYKDME